MPEIEVSVNGRSYRLVCEPGEETHLEQLAEYVRDRAEKVPRGPGVTEAQAMLMAGIDGIQNKIHPGEAMDKDLYDLPPKELKKIPTVCGSLREALENLDKDRAFLKTGGVFDDDFIDSYIELKMTEVIRFEHTPHPVEYDMYYSA